MSHTRNRRRPVRGSKTEALVNFVVNMPRPVISQDVSGDPTLGKMFTPTAASTMLANAYQSGWLVRESIGHRHYAYSASPKLRQPTTKAPAARTARVATPSVTPSLGISVLGVNLQIGNQVVTLNNGSGQRLRQVLDLIYGPAKADPTPSIPKQLEMFE